MSDPAHPSARPLRVGTVPYLVGRPLDTGLEREPGFEVSRRVPAELVRGLRSGELDVALVSSVELFRRPGYRYVDHVAVSGEGDVASVQVFLRKPIESVERVALDPSSRAAAALTRVLLSDDATSTSNVGRPTSGRARTFVDVPAGVDPSHVDADAWLEIGDPALRRALAEGAPPTFNPCREWTRRTGLPFAFAVWIVNPFVELSPAQLEAFARARKRGHAEVRALAAEASRAWSLPLAECRRYLEEECRYEPGEKLAPALAAFQSAAAPLGLCDGTLRPKAIRLPAHVA